MKFENLKTFEQFKNDVLVSNNTENIEEKFLGIDFNKKKHKAEIDFVESEAGKEIKDLYSQWSESKDRAILAKINNISRSYALKELDMTPKSAGDFVSGVMRVLQGRTDAAIKGGRGGASGAA